MGKRPGPRGRRAEQGDPVEQSSVGGGLEWPSPLRDGEWLDASGTRWLRRGGLLAEKRLRHLLSSPEVRVLLFYGPDAPTEVAPAHRDALWQRMRRYVRQPVVRVAGDHTDFDAGEFRDDQRRTLLVVEESC